VAARLIEGPPQGRFDLAHLRAIHRHLFQDVYEWAGQVREVEITKGETQFQLRRFIETGISDIHRRLEARNYLRGLDRAAFAREAGEIIGDLNHAHPFREGNGRTQLVYLKQLAHQAGHSIDLSRLDKEQWLAASVAAHHGQYRHMSVEIGRALDTGPHPARDKSKDQSKGRPQNRSKNDDRYR